MHSGNVAVQMMGEGEKCNQNCLCWVFFSYQSHSQLRPDTLQIPCIASVTQQQLSHTARSCFAGWFTYGPRLWTRGCCSRQLMAQVMHLSETTRPSTPKSPFEQRPYRDFVLTVPSSILRISQTRNIWPLCWGKDRIWRVGCSLKTLLSWQWHSQQHNK